MEVATLRIIAEREEVWNRFESRTLTRHLDALDAIARAANLPALTDFLGIAPDENAQLEFWSETAQFILPVRPPWFNASALFTTLDYLCIVHQDVPAIDDLRALRDVLWWLASEEMGFYLVREF